MDISLIYAMISFLTVLILASVYIRKKEGKPDERDDRPSSNRQIGEGGKEAGDG